MLHDAAQFCALSVAPPPVTPPSATPRTIVFWVFITGGCSGRGVQWMGVVLCNKLVYDIIIINHYTLFPLHPPLMNLDIRRFPASPPDGTGM